MRSLWVVVRLLFVSYWAYAGWRGIAPPTAASEFQLAPGHLLFALVVGAVGTRFWVMRTYLKPDRTEPWLIPSWYESPIRPSQPFQFFHLGGVSFIIMALFALLRGPRSSTEAASSSLPTEFFAGAFGVGILVGIYWALRVHQRQFVRRSASDASQEAPAK